ncbi:MAG: DNA replication/repair protein RecF [Woeseiaceae bacterium]
MGLNRLSIANFRCIEEAQLDIDSRNVAIIGANGAGKTSILEAIYFLIRGRSFRQPRTDRLARHGEHQFQLFGQLSAGPVISKVGIAAGRGSSRIRINGEDAPNLASINRQLVVEVIEPEIHRLVADGPDGRRRFIDYGVFHVEPGYLKAFRRYSKVLKQRNAALKARQPLEPWNEAIIEAAAVVDSYRAGYVNLLDDPIAEACEALGFADISLEYRPGWDEKLTMAEALAASSERDQHIGTTHVGPHRAELKISWNGRLAREQVSRGQQKLLAASLILAQAKHLSNFNEGNAILLVDDPAAELDQDSLDRVLAYINTIPGQLILTAIDPLAVSRFENLEMFHVEQGHLSKLNE